MREFVYNILKKVIIFTTSENKETNFFISNYRFAKAFRNLQLTFKRYIFDALFILTGITCASFGLKGFLLPNNFIDGGATGIALLFSEVLNLPLAIGLVLCNIPFIVLGYNMIGKKLAIKSCIAILCLSLGVVYIDFPVMTSDKTLVAVFGGFFLGAGIGLTIRGGAVADGTEILAIYMSKKFGLTIGDVILLVNIVIFSAAIYLLSAEVAMYSLLTYLAASKTIDFIVEGIEEYSGVNIISIKPDEIRLMIINNIGRGVTVYKGESGYGNRGVSSNDMKIIFTVVTRFEVGKLRSEIEIIDPNAFVFFTSVKDVKGGMVKKRSNH